MDDRRDRLVRIAQRAQQIERAPQRQINLLGMKREKALQKRA
jgi:hypothetical protein